MLGTETEFSKYENKNIFEASKLQTLQTYGNLLESGRLSDVTLNVNGKEFKCHRVILAASSPVFATMFECDLNEKRLNQVDIVDIDEKTFQELLRFIYTGEVWNFDAFDIKLLNAADKVNIWHFFKFLNCHYKHFNAFI